MNQLTNYQNKKGINFDLTKVNIEETEKYSAFCEMIEGIIDCSAIYLYVGEIKIYDLSSTNREELYGDYISKLKEDLVRGGILLDVPSFLKSIIKKEDNMCKYCNKVGFLFGFDMDNPWKFHYDHEEKIFVFEGEITYKI